MVGLLLALLSGALMSVQGCLLYTSDVYKRQVLKEA